MAEAGAALAPIAIQGVGALMSAGGNAKQGQDNAQIAEYNAKVAEQDAQQVTAQGAELARRSLVNSSKFVGAGMANYGASGVANDGSAQWVLRNSAAQGELNALTIKNNADVRATAFNNTAQLDHMRAANDVQAGNINAASSILTGASRIAGMTMGGGGGYSGGGGGGAYNSAMYDGMGSD